MTSRSSAQHPHHLDAQLAFRPKFRELSLDDYSPLVSLAARQHFEFRSLDEWTHFWTDNPAIAALNANGSWPKGWVLETAGKIIGYIGNIPSYYTFGGKQFIAATSHSWLIDPEYSAYSTLLLNAYAQQNRAALLIANVANQFSLEAINAFGLHKVPTGEWHRTGIWITNHNRFMESWLRRKISMRAAFLSPAIASLLHARDALFSGISTRRASAKSAPLVDFCIDFDERFDSFWDRITNENPNMLRGVRSCAMLQWHFRFAQKENRLWIAVIGSGTAIRAYSILVLKRPSEDGLRRMMLADFQSNSGDEHLLVPILRCVLQRCRRENIDLLETAGMTVAGTAVSSLAPYQIRRPASGLVYKALDPALDKALKDPSVWSTSFYDGGATL